jgi:hypothetical protein
MLAFSWSMANAQAAIPIKLEAATISVTGNVPTGTTAGGDLAKDWTRVNFSQTFSRTPYVFTVPTNQGSNAGSHRVRNITTTGFYIRSVEPHTFDGTHAGMQVTYLAVESCDGSLTQCEVNIPLSGGGSERWMIGHVDTSRWVGWGRDADDSANWQDISFSSPSPFAGAPAILAQVQTIANETGLNKSLRQSRPWLTNAVKNVATGSFSLSLERSEATDKDSVTAAERIAWMAAPAAGRKYLLDASGQPVGYEIIRTGAVIKGWDDGMVYTNFSSPWATAPQVIASLNSRNNREPAAGNGTKGDGGWLRRSTDTATNLKIRTGYVIDETHHKNGGQDNNRTKTSGEVAGIFAFERAFSIDPIFLDHFRIVHDGAGQTCSPESITVKACADSNCSSLYGSTVTLGLSPDTSDAKATWSGTGVSGDEVTFAGGQAAVNLAYSNAATIVLGAIGTPIPTNATKCEVNGSVGSCSFAVTQCTARPFEACDSTTSPCDENGTNLFAKISGAGNVVLNLVKIQTSGANKGKVETGFSTTGKTVTVDLVSGTTLDSNTGCPTSPQQVSGSAVGTISFASGRANAVVVLPAASNTKAAQNVRVRYVLTQGASSITSCSTDSFAIRPAYLSISSTDATSDKTLPPATPALVAGGSFTLDAQAKNLAGADITGYSGTPALNPANVESCMASSVAGDTGSCPNPLTSDRLAGTFSAAVSATGKAGGSFVFHDAGAFMLLKDAVTDESFTAADAGNQGCIAGDTGNVAGSDSGEADYGKVGCVIGSKASGDGSQAQFGRFYPGLYSLDSGTITAGCGTSTTYMGQNFGLNAIISARNQDDTKTLTRYRIGQLEMASNRVSAPGANLSPGTVSKSDADPVWSNGIVSVAWTQIKFAKPASLMSPVSDLQIGLRVVDDDHRPMKTADLLTDYKRVSGSVPELRFGRLRLPNAFGSELLALPISLRHEYWNGSWQRNMLDTCSSLSSANFGFAFPTGTGGRPNNLSACESFLTLSGSPPNYTVRLSAPGTDNTGWTDLTLNLGATPTGSQCIAVGASSGPATSANRPWLQDNWDGIDQPISTPDGNLFDDNPRTRATFGIFGANSPIIYRRENY